MIVKVSVALAEPVSREIASVAEGGVTAGLVFVRLTGGIGAEVGGGGGLDTVELNIGATPGIDGVAVRLNAGRIELIRADSIELRLPPIELRID
jgi:hypothetical protein